MCLCLLINFKVARKGRERGRVLQNLCCGSYECVCVASFVMCVSCVADFCVCCRACECCVASFVMCVFVLLICVRVAYRVNVVLRL